MLDSFLGNLTYLIMLFLRSTYRFRYINIENFEEARKIGKDQSIMFAIWHQNIVHSILSQKGNYQIFASMASRSKDANYLVIANTKLGMQMVRGSSAKNNVDKGGKDARDQMLTLMKNGIVGTLTVDGPKGPAKEVKPGIIDMAKKSGCALLPYSAIPQTYWSFKSWDRFRLAKPFSKIIVYYGKPFKIANDLSSDEFLKACDNLKNTLLCDEKLIESYFENFNELSKTNISS